MTQRDREMVRTIVKKCEALYNTTKDVPLKDALSNVMRDLDGFQNAR